MSLPHQFVANQLDLLNILGGLDWGVWTGLGAQLARDAPFSAICWSTLEPVGRRLFGLVGVEANAATVLGANFSAGFVAEILKIGVRIGVDIPVLYGEEDKLEALVKKEDVKRAVECLMNKEDEEAKLRRKRARELAEMAKRAMAEGGSSYVNVSSLIQDITELLNTQRLNRLHV